MSEDHLAGMTPEERAAYHARTVEAMAANGVSNDVPIEADYYGYAGTERWYFPDRKQYIEFKKMTEGMRRDYQKQTNHSVVLERNSGNARMGVDPAGDREALINISVVDWYMLRNGEPVLFKNSQFGFKKWIIDANPTFVEDLERAIRKANPWMAAEMTSEAIREQIEQLEEQEKEAIRREENERNFLSK